MPERCGLEILPRPCRPVAPHSRLSCVEPTRRTSREGARLGPRPRLASPLVWPTQPKGRCDMRRMTCCIIAALSLIRGAWGQTQVTDQELRSSYCLVVVNGFIESDVSMIQYTQKNNDELSTEPQTPANKYMLALDSEILADLREGNRKERLLYDRFNGHIIANHTLMKGGVFSIAAAQGKADQAQCSHEQQACLGWLSTSRTSATNPACTCDISNEGCRTQCYTACAPTCLRVFACETPTWLPW